jgi:hypothetical protein
MASKSFGTQRPKKPHLTEGKGGMGGEVEDLRKDVEASWVTFEENGSLLRTVEWTDAPTAVADAIKTSIATSDEDASYSGAALNGAVGGDEMDPPRNITITSSTHADVDAVDVVVTGQVRDYKGDLIDQTDTITLTDGGGATDAGTRAFSIVEQIDVPAQSGTGGALEFGFGAIIGMPAPMKSRAGLLAPIREISGGSVVTNGVFTTGTAQPPNGTYTPNTAPDGSTDYSLTFEVE